ncbi:hypothetical protein COV12_01460 [Candidatus Woesearchaeota archaeon CG10_big_fil_rev_8_21_14_0_10_32_24]|nr:MAG: hypothetical protein COV12_01460 [Candidatus Woesearchaeota archaeon CG10_big_fil_rev_8_21_14_0_10_32_24]
MVTRKIVLLLVLSIFLLSLIPCAYADVSDLTVTLVSQTPDPVEPGSLVDVKFKIENGGAETTKDAIITLHPKYPFKLYGEQASKNIGKLRASSTGADAEYVTFTLKVDEEAVEGDVELELEVNLGTNSVTFVDNQFLIDVQTQDAILDIVSIKSEPEQIAPGEEAKVTIVVKNAADSLLKDIKFKLDFDDTDLPLAPFQSSSERRISNLNTDFQDALTFRIIAKPDATPGLYKVPVTITYNDEKGNSYSLDDFLAVSVGGVPKVRPFIKKSTVFQSGEAGKITISIANAGSANVKFVELVLEDSEDYTLVSPTNYFYIGDIDSDDTQSEELDVYINKNRDTLHIPVMLKYVDSNNKPLQQQFDLTFDLYSTSELKKFGIIAKSNTSTFIIILIVLGGLYYYYYRNYKKKNLPLKIFGFTFGLKKKK